MSKWGSGSTFGFKFKILLGDDLQMKVVNESMANMLQEDGEDLDDMEQDLDDLVYGDTNL